MALNIVEIPYSYFPDFSRGRALWNAQIFVGNVDTDPEIPANQKQVTVRQEDGTEVQIAQPVRTSSGGVPTYNGSPVTVLVDGAYSIKVLDRFGAEEYYSPDVTKGVPLTADSGIISYRASGGNSAVDNMVAGIPKSAGVGDICSTGGTTWERTAVSNPSVIGDFSPLNALNIKDFGAVGDGVTNDTPSIQETIDCAIAKGGGGVFVPSTPNFYSLTTTNESHACLWVNGSYVTIFGEGSSSILKTSENAHVPIHFCSDQDITNPSPTGPELTDFEVYGICVRGTGIYENFGLAKGRGILFRNVKNVSVHDNLIQSMSMIGICSEGGDGFFRVQNNQIHSCRYTGINYNGRCYQSIISGNIVSKCNADPNSIAIQATGHCIIVGNTVYGEVNNAANCGGIAWGEGNYDGMGVIANNLVKHTSFGIQAIYHGSCNITGNTVINALVRDGILMSGVSTPSFTVANSDNVCSGNLIVNCAANGINCSAENTLITGNKVRNFTGITNPSASTEPDYVVGIITQQGIRIRAEGCSLIGNNVSGCVHGMTTTILQNNGIIAANNLINNTYDYSLESETSGVFAAFGHAIIERELASPGTYRERTFRATLPEQGFFNKGSRWDDPTPAIGSPTGQVVLFASDASTVAAAASSGSTVIQLNNTSLFLGTGVGSIVGIELDNGAWHWTTLVSVSSPNITIGTGIPSGRSANVGAKVSYSYWRPLANLT